METSILSAEAPPDSVPEDWFAEGAPPLELDIGCHRGRFLVEMARRHPKRNFLGIERQSERVARARKKIAAENLQNAKAMRAEGREVLARLPPSSVACVHVLFPDPWPKRRHQARRLICGEFLAGLLRVLESGGLLRILTDDPCYAAAMNQAVVASRCWDRIEPNGPAFPISEFESKFLASGRPVHSIFLRAAADSLYAMSSR